MFKSQVLEYSLNTDESKRTLQYDPRKSQRYIDIIHLDIAKDKHYNTYEPHQYSFLFHDSDEDESEISEILMGINSSQFYCLEIA